MAKDKNKKDKELRSLIKCLRCGKKSVVDAVAECKHCGSYAVRLITKKEK